MTPPPNHSPAPARLHHVAIASSDLDRSLRAYRDGLHLTPRYTFAFPGGQAVILASGPTAEHTCLEIFSRDNAQDLSPEARLLHLCLAVPDVDALYAHALQHGFTVQKEPWTAEHANLAAQEDSSLPKTFACRLGFLHGPDGEIVELFCDQSRDEAQEPSA
ncbi:MAG: VOC family protein [Planctomycetota bacterium]